MQQFDMRLDDFWRIFMRIIGVKRGRAHVELDDAALTYQFGWFQERVGLEEIVSIETMKWPWIYGFGMRIAPGRTLGFVGSSQEVVVITLREPRPIKVPFKMNFERIAASMEGHISFIDEVQKRLESLRNLPR